MVLFRRFSKKTQTILNINVDGDPNFFDFVSFWGSSFPLGFSVAAEKVGDSPMTE